MPLDAGDLKAGSIRVIQRASNEKENSLYRIYINHDPAIQFATLVHELGHLLLGHLGEDKSFGAPPRSGLSHTQNELEAESVSYVVCTRNGVKSKSETYLSNYIKKNTTIDDIDIYRVLRAAGEVEKLLGLAVHTKYQSLKRRI
ncbi:MAG: antirestriction protein ArdC [Candidatus Latescibacterota bacterium]